jgi:hypothetical protein
MISSRSRAETLHDTQMETSPHRLHNTSSQVIGENCREITRSRETGVRRIGLQSLTSRTHFYYNNVKNYGHWKSDFLKISKSVIKRFRIEDDRSDFFRVIPEHTDKISERYDQ